MLNSSTDVPYASGPSSRYHNAVSLTNLKPSCDQFARLSILCGVKGMSCLREPKVELSPAAKSIPQDWFSLARYLARSHMVLGPAPPQQFAGGFGNLNYLIELDGKPAVLRRPPSGPLPPGANDMAREYRILSSLWRAYPLAPRGLFYCAEGGGLGTPFQIIEDRPGGVLPDTPPPGSAARPDVGAALSRQLVESLAMLHAVDPAQIGLGHSAVPRGSSTEPSRAGHLGGQLLPIG